MITLLPSWKDRCTPQPSKCHWQGRKTYLLRGLGDNFFSGCGQDGVLGAGFSRDGIAQRRSRILFISRTDIADSFEVYTYTVFINFIIYKYMSCLKCDDSARFIFLFRCRETTEWPTSEAWGARTRLLRIREWRPMAGVCDGWSIRSPQKKASVADSFNI